MDRLDRIEKILEELAVSQKEFRLSQAEESKKINMIDIEDNVLGKYYGMTENEYIKHCFYTSIKKNLTLENFKYDKIFNDLTPKYNIKDECYFQDFNIILESKKKVAIVEVRLKPDLDDLDDLERIRSDYIPCFPMDKDKEIIIYMGSLNYSDDIVNKAKKKKIKLLTLNNGVVKVLKGDDKGKKMKTEPSK